VFLAVLALLALPPVEEAAAVTFQGQITTNRGCLETGQSPVFAVGEPVKVSFRIASDSYPAANTKVFVYFPNNTVSELSFGSLATNQTYAYITNAGPPTGTHRLQLRAQASVSTTTDDCSFTVVATPMTVTPGPTRTPTPTVGPSTPTPGGTLSATISTDRGCLEAGQNPIYRIGDSIVVSFRFDSNVPQFVQGTLFDILPNGFVNVIGLGLVPSGATRAFGARIDGPLGVEHLQLKGRVAGGTVAVGNCSFTVVMNGGATRTPTPTRSPAKTRTPTATATATRTPVPTSSNACVSCSGSGPATADDLVTLVRIAFGELPIDACPSGDIDHDGEITLTDVIIVLAACS